MCDVVRRRRLLRRVTRRENSPRYQTLSTEGAQGPLEASDVRHDDSGGPWPPLPPDGRGNTTIQNTRKRPFEDPRHGFPSEPSSRLRRSRNSVVGKLYLYDFTSKEEFTSKFLILPVNDFRYTCKRFPLHFSKRFVY